MFSIGELIQKINISRRTLHYYDEIGLLKPTVSKHNGYRYYNEAALLKLQTILSLKSMGLSLEEIKPFLDNKIMNDAEQKDNGMSWISLLNAQLEYADRQIEELRRKQFILRGVQQTITMAGSFNEHHVLDLMKRMESPAFVAGEIPATFPADLFSESELTQLQSLPLIGSDDTRLHEALQLLEETRVVMEAPQSFHEQELAKKWQLCFASWFNGNVELQRKYFSLIDSASPEEPIVSGLDHKLIQYVNQLTERYPQ